MIAVIEARRAYRVRGFLINRALSRCGDRSSERRLSSERGIADPAEEGVAICFNGAEG